MTFASAIVFFVIIFIVISLYKQWLSPALSFIVGVLILGISGILEPKEILAGFSNEQIAVIILLLLISEIIQQTGLTDQIFDLFFRQSKSYKQFLGRIILVVSTLSAFLNNTPLVAVMMPYVHNWSKNSGHITPSKILIPLSYTSILGGCATLIGTSTNLIVNSMIEEQDIIPGLRNLEMFEFAWVGLPMIIIGGIYLLVFSYRLLPENKDFFDEFKANARQYLVETQVKEHAQIVGKSVSEANLRNLRGLFLVKIIRGENEISPVNPDMKLQQKDILVFAGDTTTIADLLHNNKDLEAVESDMVLASRASTHLVEGVVAYNSWLENKSIKASQFRSHYDAAVVAVLRGGEKLTGKIGSIVLKAGDVLLMIAGRDFDRTVQGKNDFYILSENKKLPKVQAWKTVLPLVGLLLAIFFSTFKIVPLFLSASVLLAMLLMLKVSPSTQILRRIDYNLVMIIAMSLALGIGMTKSGVAKIIADFMETIVIPFGDIGVLIGIYMFTTIIGSLVLNKAAVALLFPVVLTLSLQMDINPIPLILCMTFAAAANFLTPIGFQTNMMVYGPGGYSFKDYFYLGLPLTIIYMFVTVSVLKIIYL